MKNIGFIDKLIRVGLGTCLLSMVFIGPQSTWGWLGLIPLFTGLINFCPLYRLLGISTCSQCAKNS